MRASSGTSPQSLIPITLPQGDNSRPPAPAKSDTPASFQDVLRQQDGATPKSDQKSQSVSTKNTMTSRSTSEVSTSTSIASKTVAPVDLKSDLTTAFADTKGPASGVATNAASTPSSISTLASTTDLAAMIIQATIRTPKTPVTPSSTGTAEKTPAKPGDNSPHGTTPDQNPSGSLPDSNDLSSMLARIALLTTHAQQIILPKAAPTAAISTAPSANPTPTASAAKDTPSPVSGATDLSTMMVQALILAANAQQTPAAAAAPTTTAVATAATTAAAGKDLPLLGLTKGVTASPLKEKKSGASIVEGSFLQATTISTPTDASAKSLIGQPLTSISNRSDLQQVTPTTGAKNSLLTNLPNVTSSVAGTANVEKIKVMSPDIINSQIIALSGLGTQGSALQQTSADVHILLSSNNDFQDALKQVMHVAQLTQTDDSRTPMRVAIEIQTPPGAIVNVYVSRQNDQWRAQLSTNDPQALTWVQDKMNSIRSGDVGMDVKWLPPQMESSSSTGGNTNSNLGWERGGQNQSNYQQPDERSQSQRQRKASPEPEVVGAGAFMNTFASIQEAA